MADSVKGIEDKLIQEKRPVAVGIPGYVLPMDVDASLFLHANKSVESIDIFPKDALTFSFVGKEGNNWLAYAVKGKKYGRARVTIHYADGELQTVHYKVIFPEAKTVANYGHFLNSKQRFDINDPYFHRSPGYITYDQEWKKQVTQDNRAWIAGLSDEGGAGSWLGAAMKEFVLPDKSEVQKLERFVDNTLWGQIQYSKDSNEYGVRKSFFLCTGFFS